MKTLLSIFILVQLTFLHADNYSLSFDGDDDYVEVDDDASISGLNAITVSCWFKPNDLSDSGNDNLSNIGGIIFKATEAADSNFNLEYALWLDQRTSYNNVYWSVSSGASTSSAFFSINDLAQDTWHHLAGVWDGSIQKIYLDGVEKNTDDSPVATMNDVSHSLYMGGSSGSIRLFPGTSSLHVAPLMVPWLAFPERS